MEATADDGRWHAAAFITAPLVLLVAFLWHPFIPNLTDNPAVVAALQADPTRWFVAHFLTALGAGFLLLGFLALRARLRGSDGEGWSLAGLPFVVVGSVLFTMLPAMEIGVLASNRAGADALAVQNALDTWFVPILMSGAVIFALGTIGFAVHLAKSHIMGTATTWIVVLGLLVMALARFVPMGAALIVSGVGGLVAFWPLAYAAREASTDRSTASPA